MSVYDDEKEKLSELEQGSTGSSSSGFTRRYSAGGSSTGSSNNTQASDGGATTPTDGGGFFNEKGDTSASSTSATPSQLSAAEKDGWGVGGLYNSTAGTGDKKIAFKNLIRTRARRRALIGGGIATTLVGGGFVFFVFTSGPLQFVHFAQLLQQFHFSRNEDFGDDRTAKLMLYAMLGSAERGRLGAATNKFADKWEDKMIANSGVRPLYNSNGRGAGYEIFTDKNNADDALKEFLDKNPKLRAAYENGNFEIRTKEDALKRGPLRGSPRKGSDPEIGQKSYVLDMRGDGRGVFGARRAMDRAVGSTVVKSGIVGSITSRVATKRGGTSWHWFNDVKNKADNRADARALKKQNDQYKKGILKRWASIVRTGITSSGRTQTDSDGNDEDGDTDSTPQAQAASDEVNDATEELSSTANDGGDTKALREKLAKAGGAAMAVGVFCAIKDLGDEVEEFKYTNNVLPMERMGSGVVSMGNQVMAGDNLNMDEVGAMNSLLYDEKNNSSWTNAESVKSELGQEGGEPMPEEARLQNINDKPDLFGLVDGMSQFGLGAACDAFNTVAGLPILRDIAGAVSALGTAAADGFLGGFGTSVEKLTAKGLSAMAGDSVNPLAEGAEFGNLANTGAFLIANDQAIATGGTALTNEEVAQLRSEQSAFDQIERSQKSLIARYFDPYDPHSLAGKAIDTKPSDVSTVASFLRPLESLGNSFAAMFSSPVKAAGKGYDYGVPAYGFSVDDKNSELFEDPYQNAEVVEPQLATLNDKYGKCFGMTVDESGVLQNQGVNMLKLQNKPEYEDCRKDKDLEIFKRYRFYIADTVTAKSLACYEGDDAACGEIGFDGGAATATTTATGDINMDDLYKDSSGIACSGGTKDLGVHTGYAAGQSYKLRLCALDMPSTSEDSAPGNAYYVEGADGKAMVNSRVSNNFANLIKDAKAAGIPMASNSSFRSMAHQQALCAGDNPGCATGNYETVAKPGTSNHQSGNAIDFAMADQSKYPLSRSACVNRNGMCQAPGDKVWEWLNKNASKYGLKQYVNEFWHFSPNGS